MSILHSLTTRILTCMIGYTRTLRFPKSIMAAVQKRGSATTFEPNELQRTIWCIFCVYWPWEFQWHTCIYAIVSVVMHRFKSVQSVSDNFHPKLQISDQLYWLIFTTDLLMVKMPKKEKLHTVKSTNLWKNIMSLTKGNHKPMQTSHDISSIIWVRPFKEQTVTKHVKISDCYRWSAGPGGVHPYVSVCVLLKNVVESHFFLLELWRFFSMLIHCLINVAWLQCYMGIHVEV